MRLVDDWKLRSVGEVAKVISGYAFKSKDFQDKGIPVIKIKNIRVGYVDLADVQCVDERFLSLDGKYHVQNGDILISLTGSHLTQPGSVVGRVAAFSAPFRTCLLNQRAGKIIITNSAECDSRFLFFTLRNEINSRAIALMAHGAASQANVSPKQVESLEILFPPIETQRKISTMLSTYDELIENNQRRIKILEEMAQTIYREWFVNFRFPNREKVQMVDSPLGKIPEGWKVESFSQVADFVNGFAFKPTHWQTTGKPIVKIKELKNGVTVDTPRYHGEDIPAKYHIVNGDLLFSWSAHLDAYIWTGGHALLNQHLFNVVPEHDYSRIFIYYALKERMQEFRSISLGTTMKHIKRSALDEVRNVFPPSDLRDAFEQHASPMLGLIENLQTKNASLRRTRDLLLPKLISGELDVSDLDINIGEEAA